MTMDSNFDDTMFDDDEFAESANDSSNQEEATPPPVEQEENSEDDLTSEVLKLKGIDDPSKISFEDESGAIVTRSWDSLSREEQINILGDVKEAQPVDNQLGEDEISLINSIRNSGMDVKQYLQSLTPQINQPQETDQISNMSDEDLFAFDLINKVGNDNITDEELDKAIEDAKANETLFKKQVDGLRAVYAQKFQEQQANIANQQQAMQQQKYQAFANVVNQQIDNFSNFAGQSVQLSNDDKDTLSDFMLTLDDSGTSALGRALQNPEILTKAAFWLLNEDSITAELQIQVQDAYTRGFNAGKGDVLNKSKLVFKPKTTSNKSESVWDSDDWD